MSGSVAALVEELLAATSFEETAVVTLRHALQAAERALAASQYRGRGKLLRGILHLRPGGAYRGVIVVDAEKGRSPAGEVLAPSASIYGWIERTCRPVRLDVQIGAVDLHGPLYAHESAKKPDPGFAASQSRVRFLGRDATHVLGVPLRTRKDTVAGMMSIEASCRSALGSPFIWAECEDELSLVADIAAPHLASRPSSDVPSDLRDPLLPVVGASMRPLVALLQTFAKQGETITLSGPTGSGKSRLARWCHAQSRRVQGPFVTLDLLGVPPAMQMGELFGWRRGAFTGAVADHAGAVERAEGGTLFLDEIDKLSLDAQSGLLRLLEERLFRPLGSNAGEREADVRFVVGTNADLLAEVEKGRFREDLYYRIHVLPVRVPPLSERRDEIADWAAHMLARRAEADSANVGVGLSPEAARRLAAEPWPGNLRQLDNVVRRAYAIARAESAPTAAITIDEALAERAIGLEGRTAAQGLLARFEQAADAFAAEAAQRPGGLDLDLADALRAFVLRACAARGGSADAALQLVGKGALLKNRNHHRALRREAERARDLARALGVPLPAAIAAWLDEGEGS